MKFAISFKTRSRKFIILLKKLQGFIFFIFPSVHWSVKYAKQLGALGRNCAPLQQREKTGFWIGCWNHESHGAPALSSPVQRRPAAQGVHLASDHAAGWRYFVRIERCRRYTNRLIDRLSIFLVTGGKKSTETDSNGLMGLYHQGWAASPVYNPPVLAVDYSYERHLQRHANKYTDFHRSTIDFPDKPIFQSPLACKTALLSASGDFGQCTGRNRVWSSCRVQFSCSYWFIDYRF